MTNVREIRATAEKVERKDPVAPVGCVLIRWDGHYEDAWVVDSRLLYTDESDALNSAEFDTDEVPHYLIRIGGQPTPAPKVASEEVLRRLNRADEILLQTLHRCEDSRRHGQCGEYERKLAVWVEEAVKMARDEIRTALGIGESES